MLIDFMCLRWASGRRNVSSMFSSTKLASLGYFPLHVVSQAARSRRTAWLSFRSVGHITPL